MDLKRSGSKKQNQKAIDDVLGDLLDDDLDFGTPKQRESSRLKPKASAADDDFYSNLASVAGQPDESDISEADVSQVAKTLADLDDLDADLFGGKYNKKKSGSGTGTPRQRTPRTPRAVSPPQKGGLVRSSTPTSPPGSASGSRPSARVQSPPQQAAKPSTAPGSITGLSRDSEKLKPGDTKQERPRTVPKAKPKYIYGDFDEDDPLAGLLSDEDDDLDEAKTTAAEENKKSSSQPTVSSPRESGETPQGVQDREPLSPRRRRLMERPPTRSGDNTDSNDTVKEKLFEPATESAPSAKKVETNKGKAAKKKDDVIFSDTEDDLLTGLDDEPPSKPKPSSLSSDHENKPAKSILDSLLGNDNVSKHLERPQSGSQREFVLDKKYQKPAQEKEDDLFFGSYMPSMGGSTGGSRPGSRRSVRFEETDDPFNKPPSRAGSTNTGGKKVDQSSSSGLDWLELASNKEKTKPDENISKTTQARKASVSESDWLGLKETGQDDDYDWLNPQPVKSQGRKEQKSSPVFIAEEKKPEISLQTQPRTSTPASRNLYEDDSYAFLHDDTSKRAKQTPKISKQDNEDWLGVSLKDDITKSSIVTADHQGNDVVEMKLGMTPNKTSSSTVDSLGFGASIGVVRQRRLDKISEDLFSTPDTPTLSTNLFKQEETPVRSRDPHNSSAVSTSARVEQLLGEPKLTPQPVIPPGLPLGGDRQHVLQHQIQQAQDQLRLQMEEQMKLKQQQEQLALQQQQSQLEGMISQLQQQYQANEMAKSSLSSFQGLAVPSHGLLSSAAHKSIRLDPLYASMDNETKVRKLEIELECLQSRCDVNHRRYEEELTAMEMSYKNRIKVLEDSQHKLEERWNEENERLLSKHMSRLKELEQEKVNMERRIESVEKEKAEEVERVRETQRKMIAELKREYEESLDRLRAVKKQEIDNIANSHSAAKSLQAVMQQVSSNAKDLGDLQYKIENWSKMGLDEREIFIRTKDEQLSMLQKRLDKQQEENGNERVRLQDLIMRLEKQLADQSRTLDEEKWKLRQEQSKLVSAQSSLEEDRRSWMEQQAREMAALDKAKDSLLQEQKMILSQLYEERRTMAEERNQLTAAQRAQREREQQHSIKYVKADAEYEVTMKSVSEERARSEARQRELAKTEEHIRAQQASLDTEKLRLQQEQNRLSELALQLKQRSAEVERMASTAQQAKQDGTQALREAQKLQADQNHRVSQQQAQLTSLRNKEKDIAEERVMLSKEKKEVEDLRRSMLCVNCRTPVRDMGPSPTHHSFSSPAGVPYSSPARTPSGVPVVSPLRTDLLTVQPGVQVSANAVQAISASIEADKSFRLWKTQAEKDKEYLMEESMFLETIKQFPYSSSRLTS
ncbi:fas-binding factor 1 homolog [Liolophura sinensis]|uniref:fas-binding factor 1 homolog n=1 Tax=Liolophura sinensis TaxID=3198878 RepID=UPI003158C21E